MEAASITRVTAAKELTRALAGRGIWLSVVAGSGLRVLPASALAPGDREALRALKPALLALLASPPAGVVEAEVQLARSKVSKAERQTRAGETYRLLNTLRHRGVIVRAADDGDRLIASPMKLVKPAELDALRRNRRAVRALLPFIMFDPAEVQASAERMRIAGWRWLRANRGAGS